MSMAGPRVQHHSLPKNTTARCQDFQAREQRLLDQFESQRGQRELELQRIQQAAVSAGAGRDFCRGLYGLMVSEGCDSSVLARYTKLVTGFDGNVEAWVAVLCRSTFFA